MPNLLKFAASMSRSPGDVLARDERLRQEREALERETRALRLGPPKRRTCPRCGDPLPPYRQFCEFCRQSVMPVRITDCVVCGRKFVAHGRGVHITVTCGVTCRTGMKAAKARHKRRIRDGIRRIQTVSDITPGQEAEMRRRVRKCPMPGCGVWMTNKPGLPNSKELDHILPINQGGTHTHGNVRIICGDCNRKRPRDGSDYGGALTLWAQAPGVSVARPTRPPVSVPSAAPGR